MSMITKWTEESASLENLGKCREALKVLPGRRMPASISKMWVVGFWTFHEVSRGWKKVTEPTLKLVVAGAFGIFQISSSLAFLPCYSHPPFLDMESPRHVNLIAHNEQWSRKGKSQDYASASAESRTGWRTSKAAAQPAQESAVVLTSNSSEPPALSCVIAVSLGISLIWQRSQCQAELPSFTTFSKT